jgi:hypothetical protein
MKHGLINQMEIREQEKKIPQQEWKDWCAVLLRAGMKLTGP